MLVPLRAEIDKLIWQGKYWGKEGALEKSRIWFQCTDKTPADRIKRASDLYSAANRVLADCRNRKRAGYLRLKLACHLAYRSLSLIDRAWKQQAPTSSYWIDRLDELDVSCAVWLRYGWLRGGRYKVARAALRSVPWKDRRVSKISWHTYAFLTIHSIRVGDTDLNEKVRRRIQRCASEVVKRRDYDQAGRIYKHLAALYPKRSLLKAQLLRQAQALFAQGRSADQLAKHSASN